MKENHNILSFWHLIAHLSSYNACIDKSIKRVKSPWLSIYNFNTCMCFFLCLEKLLSNFPYPSLSLNKPFVLMQIFLIIFLVLDYIESHKALSSWHSLSNNFFLWITFCDVFPRCMLDRKAFVWESEVVNAWKSE